MEKKTYSHITHTLTDIYDKQTKRTMIDEQPAQMLTMEHS